MTQRAGKKRTCIGFGEYEGKCQNEAGTPWTPYWCPRCDALRRGHISAQLEAIMQKHAPGTDKEATHDKP